MPDRPSIKKIVAALGPTPRMQAVAEEARVLAERLGAELLFVHANADVQKGTRLVRQVAGEIPYIVRAGDPDRVLINAAAEEDADLIIAGALEKEGPVDYVLGSIARRLVRHAPCSVLLLRDPGVSPGQFRKIVAAVEYDVTSTALLKTILGLCPVVANEELHVVHEEELPKGTPPTLSQSGPSAVQRSLLATFIDEHDFRPVNQKTAVLLGTEGIECVRYAREQGADLLVYPSPPRRLNLFDRFFHHPIEIAMERLPCALLVFRLSNELKPEGG